MSTKIWTAYKLKRASQLWPVVHDIRLQATVNVQNVLRQAYAKFTPEKDEDRAHYEKLCAEKGRSMQSALHNTARRAIHREYKANSTSMERSLYNFDVRVGFRQFEGGIYLIPYSDNWSMPGVLDFLASDPRLRDYHYQNQTDRPENISQKQWRERRRIWFGMDKADQWKDVLVLDICTWSMFYEIDPWITMFYEKHCPKSHDQAPVR